MFSVRRTRGTASTGRNILRDARGVALTEFAFALPILLIMTAFGLELANYVLAIKRVGDLAVLVTDNASRMGTRSAGLSIQQISEAEINDVFIGAQLQDNLPDFERNGRIILSSLQRNADGGQWIAWQRCYGEGTFSSAYGSEGEGKSGTSFQGMGPQNRRVQAPAGTSIMVTEIYYSYEPIFPVTGVETGPITEFAAFNTRASRDLSGPRNAERVAPSLCD